MSVQLDAKASPPLIRWDQAGPFLFNQNICLFGCGTAWDSRNVHVFSIFTHTWTVWWSSCVAHRLSIRSLDARCCVFLVAVLVELWNALTLTSYAWHKALVYASIVSLSCAMSVPPMPPGCSFLASTLHTQMSCLHLRVSGIDWDKVGRATEDAGGELPARGGVDTGGAWGGTDSKPWALSMNKSLRESWDIHGGELPAAWQLGGASFSFSVSVPHGA